MNFRLLRPAAALSAALIVTFGAAPGLVTPVATAAETSCSVSDVITKGHQDLAVLGSAGSVRTGVIDDSTGRKRTLDSGEFAFEVPDSLYKDIPGGGGLPSRGWVLPQIQDLSVPWVGFSTTELDAGLLSGRPAELTMEAAGPGRVVAWQPGSFGGINTIFDSQNPALSWDLPAHTHAHTGFIFTEPGAYWLTFSFLVPGQGTHELRAGFLVGDATTTADLCSTSPSAGGGQQDGLPGLANEFKNLDRAVGELGRVIDAASPTPTTKPQAPASQQHKKPQSAEPSAASAQPGEPAQSGKPAQPGAGAGGVNGGPAQSQAMRPASQAASGAGAAGSTPQGQSHGQLGKSGKDEEGAESDAAAGDEASGDAGTGNGDGSLRAVGGEGIGVESADIQPAASSFPMLTFWAGVMAGIGGLALIAGICLLAFVNLTRSPRAALDKDNASGDIPVA